MTEWYHHLVWRFVSLTICPPLVKNYNIKYNFRDKEPQAPFLFLANHSHKDDPYMAGKVMQHPINYMANVEGVNKIKAFFGKGLGVFGKKKGLPDASALKKTFSLIRSGHVVGIFPEGDRSWDGEMIGVPENIPALIKKLNVPLRVAHLRGNYLSFPRWAIFPRKGRIEIDYHTIMPDDYSHLTNQELHKLLSDLLYQNDVKDVSLQDIEFKGSNLTAGIERFLWHCPKCHSLDSISGTGTTFSCSSCHSSWETDGNQRIVSGPETGFVDLKDWNDWQASSVNDIFKSSGDLVTEAKNIRASIFENDNEQEYARGDLLLFKEQVVFSPFDDSEPLTIKLKEITYYIDNFNKSFLLGNKNKRYKFYFNGQNALKWIQFLQVKGGG